MPPTELRMGIGLTAAETKSIPTHPSVMTQAVQNPNLRLARNLTA